MGEPRKPWDQLEGESEQAYARFCCYLSLGHDRSVEAASTAGKSRKKHVNGQWTADCARFCWRSRAAAWDAENFKTANAAWLQDYVKFIRQYVLTAAGSLARHKPKSFKEASSALELISTLAPPEAIAALLGGADVSPVEISPDHSPGGAGAAGGPLP